jgi:hypothetical protein
VSLLSSKWQGLIASLIFFVKLKIQITHYFT